MARAELNLIFKNIMSFIIYNMKLLTTDSLISAYNWLSVGSIDMRCSLPVKPFYIYLYS